MRVGQALVEVLTIGKILRVKFYEINENMEFPEQNNLYPNRHADVTILIISISSIYIWGARTPWTFVEYSIFPRNLVDIPPTQHIREEHYLIALLCVFV